MPLSNECERMARCGGLPGLTGAEDRDEPLGGLCQSLEEGVDVRAPKFSHIRSIHNLVTLLSKFTQERNPVRSDR